jgi:hypothetical protein
MENEYYFLQLTVYQYDKNKIKMDYSVIPVTVTDLDRNGLPAALKSGVSEEKIDVSKMLFTDDFINMVYQKDTNVSCTDCTMLCGEIHDKKKEGKAVKTSILVYSPYGLEREDAMKDWLKHFFRKRWFYKFKYLKFLKKKENLNQF